MQAFGFAARSARSHCTCGEPLSQPPTRAQFELRAIRCQAADVEAVVALAARTGRPAAGSASVEVVEVAAAAALVVADRGTRNRFHATPAAVVGVPQVRERGAVVLEISERKHPRCPATHDDVGGLHLTALRARLRIARCARDVAGGVDDGVLPDPGVAPGAVAPPTVIPGITPGASVVVYRKPSALERSVTLTR